MKSIVSATLLIATLSSFAIYPAYGDFLEDVKTVFEDGVFLSVLQTATTIATITFVCLLYTQLRNQRMEQNLTIRPIITLDKNYADDYAIKLREGERPHIRLRLTNLGSISTGNTRIILLPLDEHNSFVRREKALKKYIKNLKDKDLQSTDSCMILNSIRDRIKSSTRFGSFNKYLVVGDDLKKLRLAKSELDLLIDRMGDKREEYLDAGKARALSLSKLNPDDWEAFYQAGIKRGDLLDQMGPIDWENFDSVGSFTRDDIKGILKEDAELIYNSMDQRKKILEDMSEEDRAQFDAAKKRRVDLWDSLDPELGRMWVTADLRLRKAYKEVKDISAKRVNLIAPRHPIYLSIDLEKSDVEKINAGNYMYFGVLVQYGKPGSKKHQYVYYLQGYFHDKMGHVDYSLDFLDA